MTRQLVFTAIAGVLMTFAVIAGAVFLLNDGSDTASVAPDTSAGPAEPTTVVEERPDCPSTGAGGIELDCLGGQTGDQAQDSGITVVNVWAWWCEPCREELPYFDELAARNPDYTVVGVHADVNGGNGAAFLNELAIDMPSYQDDDNTFAGTLGLPGVIPITVVFDGSEQVGMFPTPFTSTQQLEDAVDQAVAGGDG